MRKGPNRKQISDLLAEWQGKLGLRDWDLHLRVVSSKRLAKVQGFTDGHGHVIYRLQHKRALVYILRAKDREPDEMSAEFTVVHELLHLVVAPFCVELTTGTIAQTFEEQMVNRLTCALIGFHYPDP